MLEFAGGLSLGIVIGMTGLRLWMAYGAQDLAMVTRECKLLCDRMDKLIASLSQKKGV